MYCISESCLYIIFCGPAEWLIYQVQTNLKMAYKGFNLSMCMFATPTRCKLHCNGLCVTWYFTSYIDFFGNLAFTVDIWNMNFARFISQKNKEIFNWGQSTVTIFWQSFWLYITYNLIHFFQNLKVLLLFREMKTKRQSKERPNRWNLSAVLFLI